MTAVLISHKVVDAAGIEIAGCPVVIELQPIQGFRTSDGASVGRRYSTVTDSGGDIAVSLERNDDISPIGTYYVVTFSAPYERGGPQKYRFRATASQSLFASLIDVPTFPDTVFVTNLTEDYLDTQYEQINRGNGDPNGVIPGVIGDTWRRANGTPGETLYVKESDSGGVTGWRPMPRPLVLPYTSVTRPAPYEGLVIYETDTFRYAIYTGGAWMYEYGRRKGTAAQRAAMVGMVAGEEWYETDTTRTLVYDGSAWQRTGYLAPAGRTGCSISRSAVQSIPNTSGTVISFDTETFDSDGFIGIPGTTITIPAGLGGLYSGTAYIEFGASGSYDAGVVPVLNGVQYPQIGANNFARHGGAFSKIPLSAGQVVTVQGYQASGGALNAQCILHLYRDEA